MAERLESDLVVAPGQYAFLLDSTKGNVDVLVGPTKTSLSGTDTPVIWDRDERTFIPCRQPGESKQQFPTAGEGYYIVLENPANGNVEHPVKGSRTSAVDLSVGRKMNIPGPCTFALYPGQAADVIEGHHLRSNQYLLVRVYNDTEAQANWAKAVMKTVEGADVTTVVPPSLNMGQLLVIRGTEVSFYIPPTGIEVLADEEGNFTRDAETLERLEFCILLSENGNKRYVVGPSVVFPEPTETFVKQANSRKGRAIELNQISGVYVKVIAQYSDVDGTVHEPGEELFITGNESSIYYPRPEHSLIIYGDKKLHYAIAIPEGEGRYVLNRNTGEVRIERGPSMFLPDPRIEVVVRRILSDRECSLLYPENGDALQHNRMLRQAGQVNADAVPVTNASLSEDIGTNYRRSSLREDVGHTQGLTRSAGVPMASMGSLGGSSSAMYAASTSSVQNAAESMLGSGTDTIQRKQTNTPPRTLTLDTKYDGVVSVDVWTGYAALLVRKNGERRVVVGPQTVLLEYDERPMMLELSSGVPKTDHTKIRTGFLRVMNNRVSDQVSVESSDSFNAVITLSYHLNFEGDNPSRWFDVENYVQFLIERLRSIIRREAHRHDIQDLRDNVIDIIRDTVLGVAPENGARPGRMFHENNMHVFDLDVGTVVIEGNINALLRQAEQDTLRRGLELSAKERELAYTLRLEQITREIAEAQAATVAQASQLAVEELTQNLTIELQRMTNKAEVDSARLAAVEESQVAMDTIAAAELKRKHAANEEELRYKNAIVSIDVTSVEKKAAALQGQLAEAISRLGEEQTLATIAKAIAPLSILGGDSIVDALKNLLQGSGYEGVLAAMAGSALGTKLSK